ncbi:uncharacterized protein BDZ99DRAFT_524199 [Mytilinidion resinicola]|uniref:Cyanovirin-N domain-containing protein n=1 Tax=Mytilinidion resinicola TaxID=574789 RepID=A0A6A6YAW7_9PEZI|nr:uncharacterized protein BDZ99DRAFT_524199 [Mytilinidion resinicola]KAF2805961.1 hypothetical protein BDZ99DRAFT_524199 [Mytilinidion resinicola]
MALRMPLSATTKLVLEISSVGTCDLVADITTLDGTVKARYVDFHNAFSVNQQTWDFDLSEWSPGWYSNVGASGSRITEENILVVTYRPWGGYSVERRLNLTAFITVRGDKLEFNRWSPGIHLSASCHYFQGSVLSAWCLTKSGQLQRSSIDLNDHIGVEDDEFVVGGSGFASRVSGLRLEKKDGHLYMYAMLKNARGSWFEPKKQVNLSFALLNKDGKLVWEPSDGLFDRNGFFARFLEDVPFVGLVVAALHLNAGNLDHAKGAAIRATSKTLMAVYSGAIGATLGPVAAILLSSIMTPHIMILENRIANEIIDDPTALDRFQKVTIARVVVEGLGSMAGSGGGEIMKIWASKLSQPYVEKIANEVIRKAGTFTVEKVSGKAGGKFTETLTKIVAGEAMPKEWEDAAVPIHSRAIQM